MKNIRSISAIALIVRDYDEAIDFYVRKLGFILIEDSPRGDNRRWVLISPHKDSETRLLLAQAANAEQETSIGNQSGGRVFLFLNTDDFQRDHERMKANGVKFLEEPRMEEYGTVVVFEDLYGNKWVLIQPK